MASTASYMVLVLAVSSPQKNVRRLLTNQTTLVTHLGFGHVCLRWVEATCNLGQAPYHCLCIYFLRFHDAFFMDSFIHSSRHLLTFLYPYLPRSYLSHLPWGFTLSIKFSSTHAWTWRLFVIYFDYRIYSAISAYTIWLFYYLHNCTDDSPEIVGCSPVTNKFQKAWAYNGVFLRRN